MTNPMQGLHRLALLPELIQSLCECRQGFLIRVQPEHRTLALREEFADMRAVSICHQQGSGEIRWRGVHPC